MKAGVDMEPMIGITCGHETKGGRDRYYVNAVNIRAVTEAGGVPVLIPNAFDGRKLEAVLDVVDGILLPGGVDVDPHLYGEEPVSGLGEFDPEWDAVDVVVARLALERDVPVLGICRGMQVLNVAGGGTLYQDIPSQVRGALKHSQRGPRWAASHSVEIAHDSRLAGLLGTTGLRVNSFHHQSVKDAAPDFWVTATAPDGVVEAIESVNNRFALGVQWHPELMVEREPMYRDLFAALIEAASAARAARTARAV